MFYARFQCQNLATYSCDVVYRINAINLSRRSQVRSIIIRLKIVIYFSNTNDNNDYITIFFDSSNSLQIEAVQHIYSLSEYPYLFSFVYILKQRVKHTLQKGILKSSVLLSFHIKQEEINICSRHSTCCKVPS